MSLYDELKRRNVLRVAVGYAVLSWVVLQIMDVVGPALRLPDWTISLVTILLLLGALPVLIFSWVYELTPEGLKREKDIRPEDSVAAHTARKLDQAVIALLVAAVALYGVDRFFIMDAPTAAAPTTTVEAEVEPAPTTISGGNTIAVLPFADLSPGGDQVYFADGISEEILNLLAQHPDLRVIARTSAFQFRDAVDLREVGRALDADRILEGSVRTAGTRVRITAQLIDAESGLHIWSDTYDRELNDIFAVQDEIAGAITEELGVHLGITTSDRNEADQGTLSAYDLYLQGRKALNERGEPGRIKDAIELLQQAVEADPALAVVHGTLALAVSLAPNFVPDLDWVEEGERAVEIADRALRIDPDSVEALTAKGYALGYNQWRIAEGEAALRSALALRPNDAMAVNLLGDIYRIAGDVERSIRYEKRAIELDPLHPVMHSDLAWTLGFAGRWTEAVEHARRGIALSPDIANANVALAFALCLSGDPDGAERFLEEEPIWGGVLYWTEPQVRLFIDLVRGDVSEAQAFEDFHAELIRIDAVEDFRGFEPYMRGELERAARETEARLAEGDPGPLGGPWGTGIVAEFEEAGIDVAYPVWAQELVDRRADSAARSNTFANAIAQARRLYKESQR